MDQDVTILTLPFDPHLEGFSNERLRDHLHGRALVRCDSFPFVVAGRPFWSVLLVTRPLGGADGAAVLAPPAAAPAPAPAELEQAARRDLLRDMDELTRALFDRLRGWRRTVAHDEGRAPYMICNDQTLATLALTRPRTKTGLTGVRGLGEKKVAAYGDALLELLHGPRGGDADGRPAGPARHEGAADSSALPGPDGVAHGDDGGDAQTLAADPRPPDRHGGTPDPDGARGGELSPPQA